MSYQRWAERIASALELEIDKRICASFGEPCDFRDHTCGECAWSKTCQLGAYDDIGIGFVCRHRGSDLVWPIDTPACPAFVPRKEKNDE